MSSASPNNQKLSNESSSRASSYGAAIKLVIVAVLALFVAVSALPQYLGEWSWSTPPKLPAASRSALQALPEQGVVFPGWTLDDQAQLKLGGQNWSIQQLLPDRNSDEKTAQESLRNQITSIVLLLRPQVYGGDQPEVEWLDIKGSQGWATDSYQKISFEVPEAIAPQNSNKNPRENARTVRISTDFFRAWSKEQTYAILQWYAWPTGGSPSPAKWFWSDQRVQWSRHQRMPWVAVSLWLPIDPLGDISPYAELAESLGKHIHQTLAQSVFLPSEPTSELERVLPLSVEPAHFLPNKWNNLSKAQLSQVRSDDSVIRFN